MVLASCSDFNHEMIESSFLLYKKITRQYRDPRILSTVKELVPDSVERDIVPLLKWFKGFMRWVPKQLVCTNCSTGNKDGSHADQFIPAEILLSDSPLVRKLEVHTCQKCGAMIQFPRYNDVLEIAKQRAGRCSEWSILFGAILSSLSLDTRIVHDYLDHCWNEVNLEGKWVHADSTLDYPISLDHPHFYEENWKKNYLYVIAFTSGKIEDVTKQYTEHWNNILSRRKNFTGEFDKPVSFSELENLYNGIGIS